MKVLYRKIFLKELAKIPQNIRKNIEKLKQKGLLKRIGSDRSGHWEIVEME